MWGREVGLCVVGQRCARRGCGRKAGVAAKCALDREAHRSRPPMPPCPSTQAAPRAKAPPKPASRKQLQGGAGAGEAKGMKRGAPVLESSSNEEGEPVLRERMRGAGARQVVPSAKAKARGG